MNIHAYPGLIEIMQTVDAACMRALAPQWEGNRVPIGSEYDFQAGAAQARLNLKKYFACNDLDLDSALAKAADDLRGYVAAKNARYKRDYTLQRYSESYQHMLVKDYEAYKRVIDASACAVG